jgi:hypothetical protein
MKYKISEKQFKKVVNLIVENKKKLLFEITDEDIKKFFDKFKSIVDEKKPIDSTSSPEKIKIMNIVLRTITKNKEIPVTDKIDDTVITNLKKYQKENGLKENSFYDVETLNNMSSKVFETQTTTSGGGGSETQTTTSGGGGSEIKTSSGPIDVQANWMDVTLKVINNFEGGYWNYWECKNHPYTAMFNNSGETLFGLDRKAGAIEQMGPEGKEFFAIVDAEKKKLGMDAFCKKWTWGYKGGDLEEKLKQLASKIMFNAYEKNMKTFMKDPETKKRIESNKGLLLHMSYGCWNGPAFFKSFAKSLEEGVKAGKSDKELVQIAKDSRTKKLTGAWAKGTIKVNNMIDKEAGLA